MMIPAMIHSHGTSARAPGGAGTGGRNGRDHRRCVGLAGRHLKRAGLLYSDHMDVQDGEAIFRHACRNVPRRHISKRADSRYKPGRICSAAREGASDDRNVLDVSGRDRNGARSGRS